MSATTIAFAASQDIRRVSKVKPKMNRTPEHAVRMVRTLPVLKANPDGDLVLSFLSRVQSLIDSIARKRLAKRIARNRVEAHRELAKLPRRVRNDLVLGETLTDHQV
ncbi:hypothetical protein HT585_08590 [Ensifer sp. HO-A22]|uniref:Uncharacterized protein n=1 Tax=Ensifer oleiphilus TaxID=2742698 RepID=A0A7Y6UM87_9HYPH|nr:hypothetical protein [Ensifer oleiphilus]NVD38910.1 hypothetical protein [Ensifer oleiphilus]